MPGTVAVLTKDVLATWEAGVAVGTAERALLLHALARPSASIDDLLATAVGERDAELFGLRRSLFGERLDVMITCPDCGEQLECDLLIGELLGDGADLNPADGSDAEPPGSARRVDTGAWSVEFRLPTAGDLAFVAGLDDTAFDDVDAARRALLSRIVLRAERSGKLVDAARIPATVQRRIAEAAAQADPAADIRLTMPCPECSRQIRAGLDIAGYLWHELDTWARATLSDIHLLASCYGWSESEILALSPRRRRYFVELCVDG